MAPLSALLTVALVTGVEAFSTNSGIVSPATTSRPSTHLNENFGFDFAEDQVENTPQIILGEANYKKWVNGVDPNNMLNRQVRRTFYLRYLYCSRGRVSERAGRPARNETIFLVVFCPCTQVLAF